MDRKFLIIGFVYAILGMMLGIYMSASQNHVQMPTHAHIMLAGFVLSVIYALCHKLWLADGESKMLVAQFYIHQLAVLGISVGLFLLYGGFVQPNSLEPVLKISSLGALIGAVLMLLALVKNKS